MNRPKNQRYIQGKTTQIKIGSNATAVMFTSKQYLVYHLKKM